jgi:hypothetical protein
MTHHSHDRQARRQAAEDVRRDPPGGGGGLAVAPPESGIDFLDRGLQVVQAVRAAVPAVPQGPGAPAKPQGGGEIHVAPGQEQHLANDAWRVVHHTRTTPVIQPKLMLGPVDDPYEREAERVARQVASGTTGPVAGTDSRAPAVRRAAGAEGGALDAGVQQEIERARGRGQRLPAPARGAMEQALGADFGGVRVHTDARADRLSRSLQARAFTTGQDIFFRSGEYDPGSSGGRGLLAHELAHVVQQQPGGAVETGMRQEDVGPSRGTHGCPTANQVSQTIQRDFGFEVEMPLLFTGETEKGVKVDPAFIPTPAFKYPKKAEADGYEVHVDHQDKLPIVELASKPWDEYALTEQDVKKEMEKLVRFADDADKMTEGFTKRVPLGSVVGGAHPRLFIGADAEHSYRIDEGTISAFQAKYKDAMAKECLMGLFEGLQDYTNILTAKFWSLNPRISEAGVTEEELQKRLEGEGGVIKWRAASAAVIKESFDSEVADGWLLATEHATDVGWLKRAAKQIRTSIALNQRKTGYVQATMGIAYDRITKVFDDLMTVSDEQGAKLLDRANDIAFSFADVMPEEFKETGPDLGRGSGPLRGQDMESLRGFLALVIRYMLIVGAKKMPAGLFKSYIASYGGVFYKSKLSDVRNSLPFPVREVFSDAGRNARIVGRLLELTGSEGAPLEAGGRTINIGEWASEVFAGKDDVIYRVANEIEVGGVREEKKPIGPELVGPDARLRRGVVMENRQIGRLLPRGNGPRDNAGGFLAELQRLQQGNDVLKEHNYKSSEWVDLAVRLYNFLRAVNA